MAGRGIDVETVTTDDDGHGRRLAVEVGKPVSIDRATRWYFRKNTDLYKVSIGMLAWLCREVPRFDLVHVHALFSFASVMAAWTARHARVPYIVRPLGVLNRYGLEVRRPRLKRLSLRWIEGPLLSGAAAVHFTSDLEQAEALALGFPMKPRIIPLGVEPGPAGVAARLLGRFPGIGQRKRILFMSRIDPKKNLESLICALGLLRSQGMQPSLLVCGSGDTAYIDGLRALAVSERVGDQVVWLGHVTGDEKADALAAAQLFVLPSFSENFGIAAVEALLAGLPCILGHGVALSAQVQSAGAGLSVDTDSTSIAAGISRLLGDEAVRAAMSLKASSLARERFSPDAMGRELERLYSEICYGAFCNEGHGDSLARKDWYR